MSLNSALPQESSYSLVRSMAVALAVCLTTLATPAEARGARMLGGVLDGIKDVYNGRAQEAPTGPLIEAGFSPEGTAETLVLKFIGSQKQSIYLMGYVFTAQNIVSALIAAHERRVQVLLVLDYKENKSPSAQRAISRLVAAGILVRSDHRYPIFHDKVMVGDQKHVQLGSFNYTAAAERHNSENAMVIWHNVALAQQYYGHFKTRWDESQPYDGTVDERGR